MAYWVVFHTYETFDDVEKCEVIKVCNSEEEAKNQVNKAYSDPKYDTREYSSNQFWYEKQ